MKGRAHSAWLYLPSKSLPPRAELLTLRRPTTAVPAPFAVAHHQEPVIEEPVDGVDAAIQKAKHWLLQRQREDGHWVAELEGDTILESEYVLLEHFLGNPDLEKCEKLCRYMLAAWQNEDGGFPIYPGGPSDVSASVKAYFACKLAGHSADAPHMVRIRECVHRLGGVTRCNTFTKLYLAVFGQYDWDGVPTIPRPK